MSNRLLSVNGTAAERSHSHEGGFSYIETLMALAVFCIALIPVFPLLSQTRKNDEFARSRYRARLLAETVTATVKRNLMAGETPADFSFAADESFTYGCWVDGGVVFLSENAPGGSVNVSLENGGYGLINAHVVVTLVWDGDGALAGRSAGIAYVKQ